MKTLGLGHLLTHMLHEKPLHCQNIGVECVNSEVYQDIVTEFIAVLDVNERNCWFQQDSATCHTQMQPCSSCVNSSLTILFQQGYDPCVHQILSPPDNFFLGVPENQCL
ncbi:hypothetical protein PR048_011693 [Dryococelus australis]|uniref:Uncharacterized protein n=1 Tax=Dryococelus australis TaxID=614101 RepID=A0ABQ9HM92_9NEOP|nr:hypothetical protein PR048_011693 [Dryococelus australis]